jgi:tRNA A37 N6-isopentenylltransferase MiaA
VRRGIEGVTETGKVAILVGGDLDYQAQLSLLNESLEKRELHAITVLDGEAESSDGDETHQILSNYEMSSSSAHRLIPSLGSGRYR